MGVVQASQGDLPRGSELLRSEVAVVCGLAEALFASDPARANIVAWSKLARDYDGIRDHISRVVEGFEGFNERIRTPGGFYLPNPVRDEQRFDTVKQRALFTVNTIPKLQLAPDELLLMTIRSHDQFNTTIYGLADRYRGVSHGRRVVFMNAADLERLGLTAGQWVDLIGHYQGETRRAERFMTVAYEIPTRCAAAYFPETNVLVPVRSVAEGSNTPTYKTVVITVHPSA
jgi:anaerobic selenocysteine-containing dehydrogenase